MQYSIHEDNMEKLLGKLKKIENKCNKYGCSFKFSEIGEEFKQIQHKKEIIGAYGVEVANTYSCLERFVIIEVEGKAIINDWQFVATLEHTENGNIIRSYSDYDIPNEYRTVAPKCEHCNIMRDRKDTYLIRNVKTNELKQVGKSCLKDYTNGLSAEAVALFESYYDEIAKLNNYESFNTHYKRYTKTDDYLLNVYETIKHFGFVNRALHEETDKEITSVRASRYMYWKDKFTLKEMEDIGYNADTEENKNAVNKALDWLKNCNLDNQYINNLKVACATKFCEYRDFGILASLFPTHFKAMETEAERIAREKVKESLPKSKHIGNIGDKIKLENVTIKCISKFETDFGMSYIYKIVDTNNNTFIWKTGKPSIMIQKRGDNDIDYIDIEDLTAIQGTIKEHSEYNSEKQTVLTRCKMIK